MLTKEQIQDRLSEIPKQMQQLIKEENQLLGYMQCIKDNEPEKEEKKDK